jgi:hypothetical protein
VEARISGLEEIDYSIHFHVWTQPEFLELLEYARERNPFLIEEMQSNGHEFIAILRRTS